MKSLLKTVGVAIAAYITMTQHSYAWWGWWWHHGHGGGHGGTSVPEIDGPAGIAAMALLVSVVAVLYNRARK
jgi:hypothetical protein